MLAQGTHECVSHFEQKLIFLLNYNCIGLLSCYLACKEIVLSVACDTIK